MPLTVTSHVGNDVLQNAAYFNSVPKIVNEYVSNSIDNAPDGTTVSCSATIGRGRITIKDDAVGMSYGDLANFFCMHADNILRKRGRKVRGRFGTGKSAAFGLANVLRVHTVKDGMENVVELRREDLKRAEKGSAVPVRELVTNRRVRRQPGTIVEIEDFMIKRLEHKGAIVYLEQSLNRHLALHNVSVNGVRCEFREPEYVQKWEFDAPPSVARFAGDVKLEVKVARSPLETEVNGIAVLANGFLHAMTLGGAEGKPEAEFLFGQVDVPALDLDTWEIPPFHNTRDLSLNPHNPLVGELEAWIAECVELVRDDLATRAKKRRQEEHDSRLSEAAAKIARLLNEDYADIRRQLAIASPSNGSDMSSQGFDYELAQVGGGDELIPGPGEQQEQGEVPGSEPNAVLTTGTARNGHSDIGDGGTGSLGAWGHGSKYRRPKGGFWIDYENRGVDRRRSRYIEARRTIFINMDHPQMAVALSDGGIEGRPFQLLSYEVAFSEYAAAVVMELAHKGIEIADAYDAVFKVQDIQERLGRTAAAVLANL